ncbi:guanosine-3',5'-bis(diphosphate) 3'-diphosphatase, partial [Salmonella enterica subsp. enterica]
VPIEIQIRTREMEEMANNGIAAHWLYKSSGDEQPKGTHARARQWVKGVLEMQQRAGNSLEFIESVKIDLFPDEVYVFTPKGRIMEL